MEDWKNEIKERYKVLKEQGKSFFPFAVFKDAVVSLIVFLILVWLAWKLGAHLEAPADPTDTTYNPRPEWYFLFMFQALKLFPGKLEPVAAVVLPGAAILILFLLPFLDRSRARHPLNRPFMTSAALLVLAAMAYLTVAGARSPLTNVAVEKDPAVIGGKALYDSLRCVYCHSIDGKGGVIGPDLTTVAATRDEEWLVKHFKSPDTVTPGTAMPDLNLMDDEITEIIAYLKSVGGGGGPFTPEAKVLFTDYCAACHKLGAEGEEDLGPDLTTIGSYRDKNYIYKYIEDPSQLNPDATMEGYRDTLTVDQVEDLARYLAAQRGEK